MKSLKNLFIPVVTALGLALVLSQPTAAGSDKGQSCTKAESVDKTVQTGSFSTPVPPVREAGLVETLRCDGPFTPLATTDDAFFAMLPGEQPNALHADKEGVTTRPASHVLPGKAMAADGFKLNCGENVKDRKITIDATGGVKVDDATLIRTDIVTGNGDIHVIDAALLPEQS
jgi:uncharacterized surface protein with fasciclin (FAS1) repeats